MLKNLFLLTLLYGCTTISNRPGVLQDEVSLGAALNQATMSYLRGCTEADPEKGKAAFERCRDKAALHRKELDKFMGVEDSSSSTDQPKPKTHSP